MWKVINVSDDRAYSALHRTAARREYEPSIAGVRLAQGHLMLLENEQFARIRPQLEKWKKDGTIDFAPADGNEAPRAGVAIRCKEQFKIKKGSTTEQTAPYVSPSQSNTGEAIGGHKPDPTPETHASTDPFSPENQVPRPGYDVKTDPQDMRPPAPNVPEMQPHIEQAVDRVVPSGDDAWNAGADVTEEHPAEGSDPETAEGEGGKKKRGKKKSLFEK